MSDTVAEMDETYLSVIAAGRSLGLQTMSVYSAIWRGRMLATQNEAGEYRIARSEVERYRWARLANRPRRLAAYLDRRGISQSAARQIREEARRLWHQPGIRPAHATDRAPYRCTHGVNAG